MLLDAGALVNEAGVSGPSLEWYAGVIAGASTKDIKGWPVIAVMDVMDCTLVLVFFLNVTLRRTGQVHCSSRVSGDVWR